jgi:hypothetical protein
MGRSLVVVWAVLTALGAAAGCSRPSDSEGGSPSVTLAGSGVAPDRSTPETFTPPTGVVTTSTTLVPPSTASGSVVSTPSDPPVAGPWGLGWQVRGAADTRAILRSTLSFGPGVTQQADATVVVPADGMRAVIYPPTAQSASIILEVEAGGPLELELIVGRWRDVNDESAGVEVAQVVVSGTTTAETPIELAAQLD